MDSQKRFVARILDKGTRFGVYDTERDQWVRSLSGGRIALGFDGAQAAAERRNAGAF